MNDHPDLARDWPVYARFRSLFAGRDLLVCEFHCDGQARPWFPELTQYGELDLPREGAHLRALGRQRHVIDPATAAFSAAEEEYSRSSPTSKPQTSTLIVTRGALASTLIPRDAARAHRISAEVATLHLRLLRAPDPVAVEETALAIVGRIFESAKKGTGGAPKVRAPLPSWRRLAEEIQHVIAIRFAERLTLEKIAALCKTSPFHASRVFRAVTGETIHRHLTRVRLRIALFELRHGAGRLTDIALSAGFSSHSHFTSSFRTEFGLAPSCLMGSHTLWKGAASG
ncbi:MAG TPA: helix-turn-helix domain-containing protein [Polyangiaceae bacterium]|nr:helix-turn-helix domain-containing protein [Polyangiaceae bacterium]